MARVLLHRMATSVDRVVHAGTEKFLTCNIMSTKHKVRQPEVIEIHEEWAEKNGYRVAASHKRQGPAPRRLYKVSGSFARGSGLR